MTREERIEKAREAFTRAWADADTQGDYGNRSRRGITAALAAVQADIKAEALEAARQQLARAVFAVDGKHHLRGTTCLCGFEGDARARTQTEHITSAVIEEYDRG